MAAFQITAFFSQVSKLWKILPAHLKPEHAWKDLGQTMTCKILENNTTTNDTRKPSPFRAVVGVALRTRSNP